MDELNFMVAHLYFFKSNSILNQKRRYYMISSIEYYILCDIIKRRISDGESLESILSDVKLTYPLMNKNDENELINSINDRVTVDE